MLTGRPASRRAHLRSHSGHNAGLALSHAPTAPEYTVPPHLFRVLLLERRLRPTLANSTLANLNWPTLAKPAPKGGGAQNFALFLPFPATVSFSLCLSGGSSSRNFGPVICHAPVGPQLAVDITLRSVSGSSCASPGGPVPAFKNTTRIQREDTQRDTKRAKRWREREEKERNFGRSGGGRSGGGRSSGGRSGGGRSAESKPTTTTRQNHTTTTATTQRHCNNTTATTQQHTQHNNTTAQQHNTHNKTHTTKQQQQQPPSTTKLAKTLKH